MNKIRVKSSRLRLDSTSYRDLHWLVLKRDAKSELIYFKVYKSQIPVIEQAIETAALMLGTDKSRGYCLEMSCANFLAGASIDGSNPEILLQSISRYYKFLPGPQREAFLSKVTQKAS